MSTDHNTAKARIVSVVPFSNLPLVTVGYREFRETGALEPTIPLPYDKNLYHMTKIILPTHIVIAQVALRAFDSVNKNAENPRIRGKLSGCLSVYTFYKDRKRI